MRVAAVPGLLLLLSIVGSAGCIADSGLPEVAIDGKADDAAARATCDNAFARRNHEAVLSIPEPHEPFSFCTEAAGLNLTNASWLAFLAANEYAHFGYLAPVLGELGFGDPVVQRANGRSMAEADFWFDCCDAMYWLRCVEQEVRSVPTFDAWPHACSREWIGGQRSAPAALAAEFERWLVQENHEGWRIQFVSGGQFETDADSTIFREGTTQLMWIEHATLPLLVLSFRGTEPDEWGDICADMLILQSRFSSSDRSWGEVHRGFLQAFHTIYGEIIDQKLAHLVETRPETQIWVTGHSLGAALATLMTATILERMDQDPVWEQLALRGLVTFGSPIVGDQRFAETFESRAAERDVAVLRFVHGQDAVTKIPTSMPRLGLDYQHVGEPVYLGTEGDELCPDGEPCLRYDPESAPTEVIPSSGVCGIGAIRDHGVNGYYDRIVDLLDAPEMDAYRGCSR